MKTNTRLLNRSACRSYALALIATRRAHLAGKITRVSGRYLARLQGSDGSELSIVGEPSASPPSL